MITPLAGGGWGWPPLPFHRWWQPGAAGSWGNWGLRAAAGQGNMAVQGSSSKRHDWAVYSLSHIDLFRV